MKIKKVIQGDGFEQSNRVYGTDGIAPTLCTNSGGSTLKILTGENKQGIRVKTATKTGYEEAYPGDGIQLSYPDSETRRGRVQSSSSSSLQCSDQQGTLTEDLRIRKLTPRECFRLQGWTDDYYDKAEFVNSKAQLYKQAGNGVTVNVIYEIAKYLKTEGESGE